MNQTVAELIELRDRELRKNDSSLIANEDFAAPAVEGKNMNTNEVCMLCGVPGECLCLAKAEHKTRSHCGTCGKVHPGVCTKKPKAVHLPGLKKSGELIDPNCPTCRGAGAVRHIPKSAQETDKKPCPTCQVVQHHFFMRNPAGAVAQPPAAPSANVTAFPMGRVSPAQTQSAPGKIIQLPGVKKSFEITSKGEPATGFPVKSPEEGKAPGAVLPGDKAPKKVVGVDGSGGSVKAGEKLDKGAMPPTAQPAKPPGGGPLGAPKPPKPMVAKPPAMGAPAGAPKPPAPTMKADECMTHTHVDGKCTRCGTVEKNENCYPDGTPMAMSKGALRPNVGSASAAAMNDSHRAAVQAVQTGPAPAAPKATPRPHSDFDPNAFRPVPAGAAKVQIPGLKPPKAVAPSPTAKPSGFDPAKVRMGKTEDFIKTCPLCMKTEHPGTCS